MSFRRINWDPIQLAKLRLEQRLSYPRIARIIGCDHTTIMKKCREFGIEDGPAPKPRRRVVTAYGVRHTQHGDTALNSSHPPCSQDACEKDGDMWIGGSSNGASRR